MESAGETEPLPIIFAIYETFHKKKRYKELQQHRLLLSLPSWKLMSMTCYSCVRKRKTVRERFIAKYIDVKRLMRPISSGNKI